MSSRPQTYRQSPYNRDIGAGRVRSLQILLLTVGGVLILFGILRGIGHGAISAGYEAINRDDYTAAAEKFLADVNANPTGVTARIGLTLAYLGLGRVNEAEEQWQWLTQPVREGTSIESTPIDDFRRNDPRKARSYEGEILWADAWLRGELAVRSVRRNSPRREQLGWKSQYEQAVSRFRQYVTRREGQLERAQREAKGEEEPASAKRSPFEDNRDADDSVSGNIPGLWTRRLAKVAAVLDSSQRASDLSLALQMLDVQPATALPEETGARTPVNRDPPRHSSELLRAVLERHLNRAKDYRPADMEAHAWWLQVMAELARRGEFVSRGVVAADQAGTENSPPQRRPAAELLEDDFQAMRKGGESSKGGIGEYDAEELRREPVISIRLRFSMAAAALALRDRHRGNPERVAELLAIAESETVAAREEFKLIRHSHPNYGELAALEAAVQAMGGESPEDSGSGR